MSQVKCLTPQIYDVSKCIDRHINILRFSKAKKLNNSTRTLSINNVHVLLLLRVKSSLHISPCVIDSSCKTLPVPSDMDFAMRTWNLSRFRILTFTSRQHDKWMLPFTIHLGAVPNMIMTNRCLRSTSRLFATVVSALA